MIAASLMLGGSLAIVFANRTTGGAVAAAATSIFRDPLGVMDARSPGEREAGALTQTKERKLARIGDGPHGPHERVLSVVRERPPFLGLPVLPAMSDPFTSPLTFASALPQDLVPLANIGPSSFSGGPNSPGASPLNRAVQLPQSIPDAVAPPSGAVGAVPEPSTWAMAIIGFLAVAFAMRRGRQAAFGLGASGD